MKNINKFKIVTLALVTALVSVNCDNNDNDMEETPMATDFSGTYTQQDQMGRPAINTVFVAAGAPKDEFNGTIPSQMGKYQPIFQSRLMALNAGYTTNALGQSAADFTGLLATDVLNVSKTAKTTFFDGTNILTGRTLADDVIDVELLLIFGGPMGTANAAVTSDHVDKNDKDFATTFPYLASPW